MENQEITQLKEKIINRLIVLTALLLVFPYITSLFRSFQLGWMPIFTLHSLLYFSSLVLAILRKRLNIKVKIIAISTVYFLISYVGSFYFSVAGGYFFIIMAVAILTFLVKRKTTIFILVFVFLSFVIIAYAFVKGILVPHVNLNELSRLPLHWAGHLMSLFSLILIFLLGFGDIYNKLLQTLAKKDATEIKYRMLFEEANDAIFMLKGDGMFFDCNQKACEMFKYEKKDLIGQSIINVSPPIQNDGQKSEIKAMKYILQALKGEVQQFEWQHINSLKEPFDLSVSLNKIELNEESYVQAILRDITDRKRKDAELEMHRNHLEKLVREQTKDLEAALEEWKATTEDLAAKKKIIEKQNIELNSTLSYLRETQSQLIQSEKMASLGTLTAGVSHEINNPLQYLSGTYYGFVNYFKNYGSNDESATDLLLSSTETAIDRISAIVKGLNQFSRDNQRLDEDCDIHSIIDDCLVILNHQIRHKITVVKDYWKHSLVLKGNVGQLHQVFTNLLSNAIQAIEKQGLIYITTRMVENAVSIEIKDTGCGISQEDLDKITDPFFTTKDPGHGTGLGLSITYSIIKDHKGKMDFHSEKTKGTIVEIILPLNTQQHE